MFKLFGRINLKLKSISVIAILTVCVLVPNQLKAQTATTSWVSAPDAVSVTAQKNDIGAFQNISLSTTATTGATLITPINNRYQVSIFPSATDTVVWFNIGTTTATINNGVAITTTSTIKTFVLGGSVPCSYISTNASPVCVFQEGNRRIR